MSASSGSSLVVVFSRGESVPSLFRALVTDEEAMGTHGCYMDAVAGSLRYDTLCNCLEGSLYKK